MFDTEAGDEMWLRKLHSHGFSTDDIECIVESVRACSNRSVDGEGNITPQLMERDMIYH